MTIKSACVASSIALTQARLIKIEDLRIAIDSKCADCTKTIENLLSLLDHNRCARIPLFSVALLHLLRASDFRKVSRESIPEHRRVEAQVLKSFAGIVIGTFLGAYIATTSPHMFNTWVGNIAWADWR